MSRDTQPRCDACGNELGRALPSYKRYGDAGKLLSFCDAYCNGRYDERQIAISAEDARRILNWNMLYGGQGHLAFDLQAMLRTRAASLSVSPVPSEPQPNYFICCFNRVNEGHDPTCIHAGDTPK